MPKRMLDDSLLSSGSLARCSPRAQDAFPRFLLLMDDFGCADANPRVLMGKGWPLRNDVSADDVTDWLEEYVAAGMAVLWTEADRRFVYLTGWLGPHGQRERKEYDPTVKGDKGSKRRTPPPPADLVAAVKAGARLSDGRVPGVDRETEIPAANPGGKSWQENPNDSVPGREVGGKSAGNPVSRSVPAPAVTVAVAEKDPLSLANARETGAADRPPHGGLPTQDELRATKYPRVAALLAAVRASGHPGATWPKENSGCAEAAMALGDQPLDAVTPRVCASICATARLGLGWHFDAIRGGPRPLPDKKRSRGMAIPDTDWTSEAATKL